MPIQGEIPSGHVPEETDDFFVEVDENTGRYFNVPKIIKVHNPMTGDKMDGTFRLDPTNGSAIEISTYVHPTTEIGFSVIIGADGRIMSSNEQPTVIGNDVFIEDRVYIKPGVNIGDNATIRRKAELEYNVTIGENATVGSRAIVRNRAIIEPGAQVFNREIVYSREIIPNVPRVNPNRH